ncbi:hypothetical protein O3G_MSEX012516 [Manduca sexta]|uniref:Uncharacterized protein n=2 Tax=Manduca sexta TaxID=7130 RepID=A0A922CWV4_MANSE|nr:hypothetical protein O3G_MSEX012516 [Manduca sexta]
MCKCEHKLMQFERKIEKVNAAMVLLESKLSSIPELDNTKAPELDNKPQAIETQKQTAQDSPKTEPIVSVEESKETKSEIRPEYEKFVKMVQVGVPLQAVKLKVSLEGLDPNIFEAIMNK